MPRRVLIFSVAYHPFVGGAEVALRKITDSINSADIEFDMVTLRFDRTLPRVEKIGNVTVHRIGFTLQKPTMGDMVKMPLVLNKFLMPFLGLYVAHRLHLRNRYDAIWAVIASFAGFAALFFKLTHPRVPYLLTLQEGDPLKKIRLRVRFITPLFREIFRRADVIQAISTYLADFAKTSGARVTPMVVPNGADIVLFSNPRSPERRREIREKIGIRSGDKVLMTTSRLVQKNAVQDTIESLRHLPAEYRFFIIGVGPQEQRLRALVRTLNLKERVSFLGLFDHATIADCLHTADAFVRPSLSEGMGNSFIEAMAAGVPVIATPVGGIPDFLVDPSSGGVDRATGLFCEPRNPKSIAEKVLMLESDPGLRTALTQNARKLVTEKYDWSIVTRQMRERVFAKLFSLAYTTINA